MLFAYYAYSDNNKNWFITLREADSVAPALWDQLTWTLLPPGSQKATCLAWPPCLVSYSKNMQMSRVTDVCPPCLGFRKLKATLYALLFRSIKFLLVYCYWSKLSLSSESFLLVDCPLVLGAVCMTVLALSLWRSLLSEVSAGQGVPHHCCLCFPASCLAHPGQFMHSREFTVLMKWDSHSHLTPLFH